MMNKKLMMCLTLTACVLVGCENKAMNDNSETASSLETVSEASTMETTVSQELESKFVVNEGEISYKIDVKYKDWLLEENCIYIGSDGRGVYYYSTDENDGNFNVFYQEFGNDDSKLLHHEAMFDFACMYYVCDEGLIFVRNKENVNEVFLLTADGTRLLYTLQGMRFPEVSFYKEWMYVSYTDTVNGTSFLVKVNMNDASAEEIHRTQIEYSENGRATGDRIVFNGGTNERVYFQIMHLENEYDEECKDVKIYAYEAGKMEVVLEPDDVCIEISGLNGRILLAEYAVDDPFAKTGKIYKEGSDAEPVIVDGIENYNVKWIWGIRCYEDLMLFNTLDKIYLYDTKEDAIKTFECEESVDIKISYCDNFITYYSKDKQQVCIITMEK